MNVFSNHQRKQIEIINHIEQNIKNQSLQISAVSRVDDYAKDKRICLTSIHLPRQDLIKQIQKNIILPLKNKFPHHYYYDPKSLHITIKSIRVINHPPHFDQNTIKKVKQVFSKLIPNHKAYNVYFYRLLLFPMSLALMATTDESFDEFILDLDQELKQAGIPDDKRYINARYFFANMTLARFYSPVSKNFEKFVKNLSESLKFEPYTLDSVTLCTANAVFKKFKEIETYKLKPRVV
ncbi:MAG: hypothetical protein PVJ09_05595 [Candidatus Woesebacteria bacterium]|jgi:2'-5' RNA ligase